MSNTWVWLLVGAGALYWWSKQQAANGEMPKPGLPPGIKPAYPYETRNGEMAIIRWNPETHAADRQWIPIGSPIPVGWEPNYFVYAMGGASA